MLECLYSVCETVIWYLCCDLLCTTRHNVIYLLWQTVAYKTAQELDCFVIGCRSMLNHAHTDHSRRGKTKVICLLLQPSSSRCLTYLMLDLHSCTIDNSWVFIYQPERCQYSFTLQADNQTSLHYITCLSRIRFPLHINYLLYLLNYLLFAVLMSEILFKKILCKSLQCLPGYDVY